VSWSKDLFQILVLRCEGASELASRELDEPLGKLERMALYGHLLLCKSCRRFHRQLGLIRAAIQLRERRRAEILLDDVLLSTEARQRIARAIRQCTADETDERS
jgi:hypothetical protein